MRVHLGYGGGLTSHSAFFERGHFIICNIELEVDQEGYALMADVKKFSNVTNSKQYI